MPGRFTPPMPGQAVAAVGDQRIDQGAGGMPGRRMHHQPGRFVDHHDLVVLVHDVERDAFALGAGLLGRRHGDGDHLAGVDAIAGIADRAVPDRDRAVEDQRFQPSARQIGAGGEHAVEPVVGLALGHDHLFLAGMPNRP